MKLCIQQKVFSWKDRFTVKDEYGEDRYTVEGPAFSLGRQLHVSDMAGDEVIRITQQVWTWMAKFDVSVRGHHAALVAQKFSWLRPKYEIIGPAWQVEGNWHGHEYEVRDGSGDCIVRISKAWMTWGDSYVLDIADPADELLALAVVLAIDCAAAAQNS